MLRKAGGIILFVLGCALLPGHAFAAGNKHHRRKKGVVYSMTALAVRKDNNEVRYYSVVFRVSQRIYKLPEDADPRYLELLRESEKHHTPVWVERTDEMSDVIIRVTRDSTSVK